MRNAALARHLHLRRPRIHAVLHIERSADAAAAGIVPRFGNLIDLGDSQVGRARDEARRHSSAFGIDDARAAWHFHGGAESDDAAAVHQQRAGRDRAVGDRLQPGVDDRQRARLFALIRGVRSSAYI